MPTLQLFICAACIGIQHHGLGLLQFTIPGSMIDESSGLARSGRQADMYWTHNDTCGEPALYALTEEGMHVTKVAAVFQLVFADGQPRDVESLGVDATTRTAYLISKREAQPRLFSFSLEVDLPPVSQLKTEVFQQITLLRILKDHGRINIPRASADFKGNRNSFNWVTTMDIREDGKLAYVGTLMNGYVYRQGAGETWPQAFSRAPAQLSLPDFTQIEAGAVDQTGRFVHITTENRPARVARVKL